MIKFHDLLQPRDGLSVGELQESAKRSFPLLVDKSTFKSWSPGKPTSSQGKRLLIGVATYSEADLKLLDLLEEVLQGRAENTLSIDLFNTLDCKSHDDFDNYIPGIGKVFQTPVAGLWENGVLKEKAWGKSARDLIAQVCQLEPLTVEKLWTWG